MRPALSRGSGSSFFRTSHATFSTVVFRAGRSVMSMRGFTRLVLIDLIALLMVPAAARAQNASIAGVVKDDSGAVLPGVTVEVTSPALIEKSRSAVTDGAGQYKII